MPPKAKYTKAEIIEAAFNIVRADGLGALTARTLGMKLNTSSSPIFTLFSSMDEVQKELYKRIRQYYTDYIKNVLIQSQESQFKSVGMGYIQFAASEPKLFQILFMNEQEQEPAVVNILPIIDDNYSLILDSARECYNLSQEEAQWLYHHLWLYSHGIAVLCATKVCALTKEEISKRLAEVCKGLLMEMSSDVGGNDNNV